MMLIMWAGVAVYAVSTVFALGLAWSTARDDRREVKIWEAFEAEFTAETRAEQ